MAKGFFSSNLVLGSHYVIWVFVCKQKINQKNTWELNLIDHLCEIIKVEDENNAETNFQKVKVKDF